MKSRVQLTEQITWLTGLKDLVTIYEEIAASRMNRIRKSVLENRDFLIDIATVFEEVKVSYQKEIERLMKQKKINDMTKLSILKHNGKTITVFLSANAGLYGDIIGKTYRNFKRFVTSNQTDIVITGRLGKQLFVSEFPGLRFHYVEMADHGFDKDTLQQILALILPYKNVYVFHGKFETILHQEASVSHLTGDTAISVEKVSSKQYFFEPDLEKILLFFEEEILSSLFEQTVYESHLAKYASRMVTLDQASEGIRLALKKTQLLERLTRHQEQNKKQLNALAGLKVWRVR